ncbi:MAG TPA: hypothetical protein VL361_13595 [Candidatus Limnocylindrales bacterium]|jgi:hypothetical protein|nr:hypothetical protein [Candidatus Limnocylindrales bacterium]
MKTRTLIAIACLGFGSIQGNLIAAQRPFSDFLSRQGKFCLQLDADGNLDCSASTYVNDTTGGGCLLFVPPVANYIGWSDPKGASASFDYAGLADAALGGRLGTLIDGSIDEIPQKDGSAIVKVVLHARNAMAFAVSGFDFNGSLTFGNRVAEILAGAPPSVGSCTFKIEFRNPAPGAPLPDMLDLLVCRVADVIRYSFVGQSQGLLANGSPGTLQVTQVGLIAVAGKANSNSRVALDAFPAEHIIVHATGR